MICQTCGAQLPDDASFCYKCGTKVNAARERSPTGPGRFPGPTAVGGTLLSEAGTDNRPVWCDFDQVPQLRRTDLPQVRRDGDNLRVLRERYHPWDPRLEQHTEADDAPSKDADAAGVDAIIRPLMDKGLLHRHLEENSTQEEMSLSYVPYWIVSVSARTTVVATNEAAQIGQTATTAALMGVIFGGMGGGFGGGGAKAEGAGAPSMAGTGMSRLLGGGVALGRLR